MPEIKTKIPKIELSEKSISLILAKSDAGYCAFCPELDLVTEMDSIEDCFNDMLEAIKDYADEYMGDFELYSNSPNRAHHLPYIQRIASCTSEFDLLALLEVRYGFVR